jgi:hypothetical protein
MRMDPVDPIDRGAALPGRTQRRWHRPGSGVWGGAVLIIVGLYFLLNHYGLIPTFDWEVIWPVLLILLGAYFVARRLR